MRIYPVSQPIWTPFLGDGHGRESKSPLTCCSSESTKSGDSRIGEILAAAPHPRFPNPTIAQATCEISFRRDLEAKLSSAELYKLLVDDFPEIQAVGSMALQIIIGSAPQPAPSPPPGVPAPTFRFATSSNDQFVQISDVSFVYQTTARYPGWDLLKASILDLWTKLLPAVRPDGVTKVGLRYINRIPKDVSHPYIGDWLRASDYIPRVLLSSRRHFLARIEASPSDDGLLLITVAEQAPADNAPHGAVVLDIDRMRAKSIASDPTEVGAVLEDLHEEIWDVFWSSRTSALEEKLNATVE
jgi:uncharacterized protein (TIGR04255 family)